MVFGIHLHKKDKHADDVPATQAGTTQQSGAGGMMEKVKEALPGTAQHKATHPTSQSGVVGAPTTTTAPQMAVGPTAGHHATTTPAVAGTSTTRTTGMTGAAATGTTTSAATTLTHTPAVCEQERFTVTEDRPEIKERVTLVKEHRPVERQMVREVRATGEERFLPGNVEHLGTQERIIETTPRTDCPGGVCAVPAHGHHSTDRATGVTSTTTTTDRAHGVAAATTGVANMNLNQGGATSKVGGEAICQQEFFTVTENRPVTKEIRTMVKEHHPVERVMVREVRATGQERETIGQKEYLGTKENVIEKTPRTDCPGGVCAVPAKPAVAQTTTTTTTTKGGNPGAINMTAGTRPVA